MNLQDRKPLNHFRLQCLKCFSWTLMSFFSLTYLKFLNLEKYLKFVNRSFCTSERSTGTFKGIRVLNNAPGGIKKLNDLRKNLYLFESIFGPISKIDFDSEKHSVSPETTPQLFWLFQFSNNTQVPGLIIPSKEYTQDLKLKRSAATNTL